MLKTLLTAVGCLIGLAQFAQSTTTNLQGNYWGSSIESPDFGYNTWVVSKFTDTLCVLPDTLFKPNDWRSKTFRNNIARLKPNILRFPGGTDANYWYWADEVRQVVGDDGNLQQLTICEGTYIDIPESIDIGCVEPWVDLTANSFELIKSRTTTTVGSFLETINEFRNSKNIPVQEMFVLSFLDPFYYLGSPQMELEFGTLSNDQQRTELVKAGIKRAMRQLNILLKAYCGDCTSYDGSVLFEIGNEVYLKRYGIYLPRPDCFDMSDPCTDCFPDVQLYADMCEFLIPRIKQRFPNSQVSVAGGLWKTAGVFWNDALLQRLGPTAAVKADAMSVHPYPNGVEDAELTFENCSGNTSNVDPDLILREHQWRIYQTSVRRGLFVLNNQGWDVWMTEFNTNNRVDECEPLGIDVDQEDEGIFYLANWLHTLNLFSQINAFLMYSVPEASPWFWYENHVPVTKMCLHSLSGHPAISALRKDQQISASGITSMLISPLLQGSQTIRQVILSPPNPVLTALADGAIPAENINDVTPFVKTVTPTAINGLNEPYPAHGAMAWAFESDTSYQLLVVNLSSDALTINLSALEGVSDSLKSTTYKVPQNKIFEKILLGFESPHIEKIQNRQSASQVSIPPYGVSIFQSLPSEGGPCITAADAASGPNPDCGSTPCPDCNCTFTVLNNSSFETEQGIWSNASGIPGQVVLVNLPDPIQAISPLVGFKSLILKGSNPQPAIVSQSFSTADIDRVRIRFNYGTAGMQGAHDKLELSYSIDNGQTYISVTSWQFGIHFTNGSLHEAIHVIDVPAADQIHFRVSGISSGGSKRLLIDNIEIAYCGAGLTAQPFAKSMVAPFSKTDEPPTFEIFPNPAAEETLLHITLHAAGTSKIEVFSLTGTRLISLSGPATSGRHIEELPLSTLPAGMYIVTVSSQGHTTARKFMRQL